MRTFSPSVERAKLLLDVAGLSDFTGPPATETGWNDSMETEMNEQHPTPLVRVAGTSSLAEHEQRAHAAVAQSQTLSGLVAAYMAQYAGRDASRVHRLAWWTARFGERPFPEITDDDVFHALEDLAEAPARVYMGRDANGGRVFNNKGRRAPATINRYHVALGAVFKWAISKRRVPKGWENPCRRVERRAEENGRVRYLSEAERERLFASARVSKWDRMYLLVLLAITTGARRGTLLGLRWRDIVWKRGVAVVERTKNGDAVSLPLTPAVIEELHRFRNPNGDVLVFPSRLWPKDKAYEIGRPWDAAVRRARLRDFRFHDLRHTAASYAAQQGASLLEIADLLGHRTMAMVKRYAHLSTESKASLVNRVFGSIR